MADINERYKKAAAFSPQSAERAMLARLLVDSKPTAPPDLPFTGLTNTPGLPPFQQPDAEMARFQPPIQAQPAPPGASMPTMPVMPATTVSASPLPADPQVPPMPAPIPVGQSDGSVRGDLMAAVAAALQKRQGLPAAPWTINQGTLADQQG